MIPSVGSVLTNAELVERFKVGNMGGMRRSKATNSLVLISDAFKSLYQDRWIGDVLHYTGMGKVGDQTIEGNQNKTLRDSGHLGVSVYLFEVLEPYQYTYTGEVEVASDIYQEVQLDENSNPRNVWMFPLRLKTLERTAIPQEKFEKKQNMAAARAAKTKPRDIAQIALLASGKPGTRSVVAPQYERNPYVSEYVKQIASGKCQLCNSPAPFLNKAGVPHLETHHVVWLAQGGNDTVNNTVALCPNCHRKMHILAHKDDVEALAQTAQLNANRDKR